MTNNQKSHVNRFVLLCLYFLVSSAAFSGFFGKWNFRDDAPRFSIAQMFDGSADRPYVYRQLLPSITTIIANKIPVKIQENFVKHSNDDFPKHNAIAKIYSGAKFAADPAYEVRYYILYVFSFAFLLIGMLLLRLVCLELGATALAATSAPIVFALLIPMISTEGGYFYDLAEIAFMAGGVLLALRGKIVALAVLTAVATYNKESYLFFVMTLYPFLAAKSTIRRAALGTVILIITSTIVNVITKAHFSGNGGGIVEVHLLGNLKALINPMTYFQVEWTYGVLFPKGLNVLIIFLLCVIIYHGRSGLNRETRWHLTIAAIINIPLFLLFCQYNELRNLSLLYIAFIVLTANALDAYLKGYLKSQPYGN